MLTSFIERFLLSAIGILISHEGEPPMAVQRKQVPIDGRLFKLPSSPSEKAHLIGSRCRSCGETFFPKRSYCANCTSPDMEEVALSTRGKLETFTISRATPPGSLIQAPYGLGYVRLPEGCIVQTVLSECDPQKLEIDMDMELVIEKIREDEEGNDVMAFKFKPV